VPLDTLLPGLLGLLLFGGPALVLLRIGLLGRESRTWPTTEGTVTHAAVSTPAGAMRRDRASVSVAYRYEVGGRTFTGRRLRFGGALGLGAAGAGTPLRPGDRVTVRYHPRLPGLSTLEARVAPQLWALAAVGLVVAGGILVGLLAGA
jgi:hypothetical protein